MRLGRLGEPQLIETPELLADIRKMEQQREADENAVRRYPCDSSNACPYLSEDEYGGMYFCRDHCGLGVG